MKKLLIVVNTMGRAGAEKSLITLLESIDYSQISVSLLAIVGQGEMFADVPKKVNILNNNPSVDSVLGTSGTFFIMKNVFSRMFKGGYIFKYIPYFVKTIAMQIKSKHIQFDKLLWLMLSETAQRIDYEFDLAIAFLEGAATYYVADRIRAKTKMSVIHVNYLKAGYIKEYDLKYYQKMDYICCVSEAIKKVLENDVFPELSNRMRIFPNIIDIEKIRLYARKQGGFSDGFMGLRILTVARLHPQKGLDVAVKAFAKLLHKGYANVKWYVLGDGAEKARLKVLIKKHGLKDKFILLGSHPNPYPYIAQCDIYVQPSRFEGYSLTLQEALILNKPCVTTDFDGIPNLLQNGVDALIVGLSEKNIAQAVKMLIDNKELRKKITEATKSIDFDLQDKSNILYKIMEDKYWED